MGSLSSLALQALLVESCVATRHLRISGRSWRRLTLTPETASESSGVASVSLSVHIEVVGGGKERTDENRHSAKLVKSTRKLPLAQNDSCDG